MKKWFFNFVFLEYAFCHRQELPILAREKALLAFLLTSTKFFALQQNKIFFNINSLYYSLRKQCPPLTNPADFYMDVLGVDVNDSENSRSEIMVNIRWTI